MNAAQYAAYTRALLARLEADERVLGFVTLGSTADAATRDEWSDHDFFIVTVDGAQEAFRQDLSWLPSEPAVTFWFRETQHGLKIVLESGHLLELAVFDRQELALARINRYELLLDRAELDSVLRNLVSFTSVSAASMDRRRSYLELLSNLIVGIGRHARGERLSGAEFVKTHAVGHLLRLLSAELAEESRTRLDNLDPRRRFERAAPEMAAVLDDALTEPTDRAAMMLLDLLETRVSLPAGVPRDAASVVRSLLVRAQRRSSF